MDFSGKARSGAGLAREGLGRRSSRAGAARRAARLVRTRTDDYSPRPVSFKLPVLAASKGSASRRLSLLVGVTALLAFGCQAKIGDECVTSVDCSPNGNRQCDTAQPGGYCTVFNCEPGRCPDDAVCIAYRTAPSSLAACDNPSERARLQRTFCLRSCRRDSDCRSGYLCVDMREPNPWAASVAEADGVSGRVCVVPYLGPEVPEDRSTEVCTSFTSSQPTANGAAGDAGTDAGP